MKIYKLTSSNNNFDPTILIDYSTQDLASHFIAEFRKLSQSYNPLEDLTHALTSLDLFTMLSMDEFHALGLENVEITEVVL